jgi:hypothetical protein
MRSRIGAGAAVWFQDTAAPQGGLDSKEIAHQ